MPKLPCLELASAPEPKRNSVKKVGLARTACLILLFCAGTAVTSSAQTFTTLASFDGTNGANSLASLVQGFDGNLYGTTELGGPLNCGSGCGVVFRVTPAGKLTVLYIFCPQTPCTDGDNPTAGLVQAVDGNLYGTTSNGGAITNCAGGCGTVFKITSAGALTTLCTFSSPNCTDGLGPNGLVQASDGKFYGTTSGVSGSNLCFIAGCGTVFKITAAGALTTLYTFCTQIQCGNVPAGTLIQGIDGNFYGVTGFGGANNFLCDQFISGCGTVFKITPAGTLTTGYRFCAQTNCTDGALPTGGLVQATDGNFYGTTELGGASPNGCVRGGFGCGTLFRVTSGGKLNTFYSFCLKANCPDGEFPSGGLIQGTDGNFYGTTSGGGASTNCYGGGCGTVFKISPAGTLTTLYSFCSQASCSDGSAPLAGLVQDTDGNFYGTTSQGGASNHCGGGCGTIFKLSMGLGPFVKTLPTFGTQGMRVIILGTNLTGATGVTFNGTAAVFKVVSNFLIRTTVPAGATSGTVEVTTSSGTLKSNVVFRVMQ